MSLNRDQILEAQDLETAEVEVPEWGSVVKLAQFSAEIAESINADDGVARLVALSVVDDDGKLVFDSPGQLNSKSAAVLKRLFNRILELNGLSVPDANSRFG